MDLRAAGAFALATVISASASALTVDRYMRTGDRDCDVQLSFARQQGDCAVVVAWGASDGGTSLAA